MEGRIVSNDLDCAPYKQNSVLESGRCARPDRVSCAHPRIVRPDILNRPRCQRTALLRCQRKPESVNDSTRQPFLKLEYNLQRPRVLLRPQVRVRGRLDELRGDAQVVPRAPHASLEHIPDVQLMGDRRELLRRALEMHRRRP